MATPDRFSLPQVADTSRKPEWLKVRLPHGEGYERVKAIVKQTKLATVCEEARCPNIAECWGGGTATVMLMGEVCTRACRFCHVKVGAPPPLDPAEPENLALAVKQIWYLLQLVGHDWDLNLRATDHPEFDAWRWHDYWVPLDVVVEFKRGVYEMALTELSRYLPRHDFRNRFLRGNVRGREFDHHLSSPPGDLLPSAGFELPPGATFDPDPNATIPNDNVAPSHTHLSR